METILLLRQKESMLAQHHPCWGPPQTGVRDVGFAQSLRSTSTLRAKSHVLDALEMQVPALAGFTDGHDFWRNGSSLLDVGAGSGEIPYYLQQKYGPTAQGLDILAPDDNGYAKHHTGRVPQHHIPVSVFNGSTLPVPDASFDIVSFMAVLHHAANNTPSLLADAARVARRFLVVVEDLAVLPTEPYYANISARNHAHDPNGIFRTLDEWYGLFNATRGVQCVRHDMYMCMYCKHSRPVKPCFSFGVHHKYMYVVFVVALHRDGRGGRWDPGGTIT